MATSTIVVTYTAGTGVTGDIVTSFTVGGTAFGSLTLAEIQEAYRVMTGALGIIDKAGATAGALASAGIPLKA